MTKRTKAADERYQAALKKIKAKQPRPDKPDYGKIVVDALNKATEDDQKKRSAFSRQQRR